MTNEYHGDAHNAVQAGSVNKLEQHYHYPARDSAILRRAVELPAEPELVVDRSPDRDTLNEALESSLHEDKPNSAGCIALFGPSGIGKSTLAKSWSHEVQHRFDDGIYYIDCHEENLTGLDEITRSCLRRIGITGQELPDSGEEARGLLRSLTHGCRIAFVLDGLTHPEKLLELRPAASESLLLLVSQYRTEHLSSDGVTSIGLEPLSRRHAVELLGHIVGQELVDQHRETAERLVEKCGRQPYAVETVAKKISRLRSWSLHRALRELDKHDYQRELLYANPRILAALELVYVDLPIDQAWLYQLISVVPCTSLAVEPVAAMLDFHHDQAADLLEELRSASLVSETGHRRFQLHESARIHAAERAKDLDEQRVELARRRLVIWYRKMGAYADRAVMEPSRMRVAGDEELVVVADNPFTRKTALSWLEIERPNIVMLLRDAEWRGDDETVLALCDGALWTLHNYHKHYDETLRAFESGIEAAERRADALALARMRILSSRVLMERHHFTEAHQRASEAVETAASSGHRQMLASAYEFQGRVYLEEKNYESAIEPLTRSWEINSALGKQRGMALAEYLVARAHSGLGDQKTALQRLETAAERIVDFPRDVRTRERIRTITAEVHQCLKRHREAAEELSTTIASLRAEMSTNYDERLLFDLARPLELLAFSFRELAQPEQEREALSQALAVYEQAGSPRAAQLRTEGKPEHPT
ncbi:NB-ARC domain-containing protein [Actinopolyspora halophila]|uniref:NB-ARC domain-containing protein n=1 Tax=Actinopolyspora halophila TaxID=1850 RepID=UPI0012F9A191|nr:NB-ARC domain-containing protein [Actinopolyspora halophila]